MLACYFARAQTRTLRSRDTMSRCSRKRPISPQHEIIFERCVRTAIASFRLAKRRAHPSYIFLHLAGPWLSFYGQVPRLPLLVLIQLVQAARSRSSCRHHPCRVLTHRHHWRTFPSHDPLLNTGLAAIATGADELQGVWRDPVDRRLWRTGARIVTDAGERVQGWRRYGSRRRRRG